jgi:hypothetical protein
VAQRDKYDSDGLRFAAFHREPGKLYVSNLHDGRLALFEFDLRTRTLGSLVEARPEVDVSAVETHGWTGEAVGVRYTDDRRRVRYFDERVESEYAALRDALTAELRRDLTIHYVTEIEEVLAIALTPSSAQTHATGIPAVDTVVSPTVN